MYAFRRNWISKEPRVTSFKKITNMEDGLQATPGCRWLISLDYTSEGPLRVQFVDVMTGKHVYEILESDESWTASSITTISSYGPNEVILGVRFQSTPGTPTGGPPPISGREIRLGGDDQQSSGQSQYKYTLFRVILFEDIIFQEDIQTRSTPLCSFMGVPPNPQWAMGKSFCALWGNMDRSVNLINLNTGQVWVLDMERPVISLEIFDAWLVVAMRGQSFEMVAIDIHRLSVQHPHSPDGPPYALSFPDGVDILKNTICQGLWDIRDYHSKSRVFLAPPLDRGYPEREEDTYVLLISQYGKYWSIRLHLSCGNSSVGAIEVCLSRRKCDTVACKRKKYTNNSEELPNIIAPFLQNPMVSQMPQQDFGLQVARFIPTIHVPQIVNQIAGLDSATTYHELNMSQGHTREDRTKAKSFGIAKYIDGDMGMVLTTKATSNNYDYGVYWF